MVTLAISPQLDSTVVPLLQTLEDVVYGLQAGSDELRAWRISNSFSVRNHEWPQRVEGLRADVLAELTNYAATILPTTVDLANDVHCMFVVIDNLTIEQAESKPLRCIFSQLGKEASENRQKALKSEKAHRSVLQSLRVIGYRAQKIIQEMQDEKVQAEGECTVADRRVANAKLNADHHGMIRDEMTNMVNAAGPALIAVVPCGLAKAAKAIGGVTVRASAPRAAVAAMASPFGWAIGGVLATTTVVLSFHVWNTIQLAQSQEAVLERQTEAQDLRRRIEDTNDSIGMVVEELVEPIKKSSNMVGSVKSALGDLSTNLVDLASLTNKDDLLMVFEAIKNVCERIRDASKNLQQAAEGVQDELSALQEFLADRQARHLELGTQQEYLVDRQARQP